MTLIQHIYKKTQQLQYLILILVLIVIKPPIRDKISVSLLASYMIILGIVLFIHFTSKSWKNYFRIDILFIIGFVIVHFQWPIMLTVSDIEPLLFTAFNSNLYYINYGTWLSVIGMAFWSLGFSYRVRVRKRIPKYFLRYKRVLFSSIFFLFLFLVTAGKTYLTGEIYKEGGTSESISGVGGYMLILYNIMFFILTVVVILKSSVKNITNYFQFFINNIPYTLIFTFSVLIFLIAGDRSSALMFISGFLVLYGNIIKPISFRTFLLIGLSGAIVLTLVGIYRSAGAEGASNFSFDSIYSITLNLANSARTLYIGISAIDQIDLFFYGKLWSGNILGVFPFAQSIYLNITGEPEYLMSTANYITYIRLGPNPNTGLGTSFIIDIFLNFGLIGVCVIMFLHGYLIKFIQVNFEQKNNIRLLLLGVILGASAFYVSRANVLNPIRMITWGGIIISFFYSKINN